MVEVTFAKAFRRHVDCPVMSVPGDTVGEVLGGYFEQRPQVRGYVLDDGLICRDSETRYTLSLTSAGSTFGELWLRDWADALGHAGQERDDVVLDGRLDLVDPRVVGPFATERLDGGLDNGGTRPPFGPCDPSPVRVVLLLEARRDRAAGRRCGSQDDADSTQSSRNDPGGRIRDRPPDLRPGRAGRCHQSNRAGAAHADA